MARPTLRHHRKFRALSRALRSPALAWGTLELLWHVGYDQCDEYLGTAQDVEEAICWRGKPGAGLAVLLACGWLDETPDGYRIHDLWDHCPDYVRKRRAREDARKQRGRPPNGGQAADTRPPDVPPVTGQTADRRRTGARTNGSTPAPAPRYTDQDQDPAAVAAVALCGNVENSGRPTGRVRTRSPDPITVRQLTRLVVDLVRQTDYATDADLKEDVKRRCASLGLAYSSDSVRKAMDGAKAVLAREARVSA